MAKANGVVDLLDPNASSKNTLKLENTEKRDTLIAIEKKYQAKWQEARLFESNAPSISEIPTGRKPAAELRREHPKYFGTFAYPYMNGTLHAGHSFTASKVEFTAGFARMEGKRVLFPLGFHCTGMPIKACADKLTNEVKMFGKNFEKHDEVPPAPDAPAPAPTQAVAKEDITKFSSKKSKASAKTTKLDYQFQIMLALGIPREEIHKFADAGYWLEYFPPICKRDLNNMGARIDWRRSFVTTDANPYYDAFVRWQMNRLHELDKIQYGVRYTVYSPKDGQPCMDHDRTSGEGVGPQDYTAMKLKVKEWAPEAVKIVQEKIPSNANVYFVPATLRPETMYGQTCCFVGPKISYGIFKVNDRDYYVVTKRAAWNMAFQGTFFKSDNFPRDASALKPVVELLGSSVVGTLVNAPLSIHTEGVRILPMESVLPTKGTGVVTSVPSDSPDDYATIKDLAKKAEYYGIKKEWAELEIPEIINTPSYGNLAAKSLVEKMKINSPKDTKQLAEAKDLAYKEGYYKGTMLMGEFKGQPVEAAKPKVKEALIKSGDAFEYAEPNGQVVSRSGDECVVAYLGQWFLNYGENDPEWRQTVTDYVCKDMETYASETKNGFEKNLDWLNRWACARTYGLGSKLPWDSKFLVESLSDSTIYMAYYTISHFLHSDIFGQKSGLFNIKPEQMIDEVWDAIFCRREINSDVSKQSGISKDNLEAMRREFEYWYPLDMRVSGKDLIPNHLTFFLYIHLALFPREYWPSSVRANGHLLLNGEKMSKSTGNFLTLSDAVQKFGADACRIALADAGDGVEDANFEETVANQIILRLYTLKEWCEEVVADDKSLRTDSKPTFWDILFENEMNSLVHEAYNAYKATDYKVALKSALYDFTICRDFYREATIANSSGMRKDLVLTYIELQALLLQPIAPHWADYIWQEILHKPQSIQLSLWPVRQPSFPTLSLTRDYIRVTTSSITSTEASFHKKAQKGKTTSFDPKLPKKLTIYFASSFPAWQDKYIALTQELTTFSSPSSPPPSSTSKSGPPTSTAPSSSDGKNINNYNKPSHVTIRDKELTTRVGKMSEPKKAMPFVQSLRKRLLAGDPPENVFSRKLPFDEEEALRQMVVGLKKTVLGCRVVEVVRVHDEEEGKEEKEGGGKARKGTLVASSEGGVEEVGKVREGLPSVEAEKAVPGSPSFGFENVKDVVVGQ